MRVSTTLPQWRASIGQMGRPITGSRPFTQSSATMRPATTPRLTSTKAFTAAGGKIIGGTLTPINGNQLRRLHGKGAAGEARCAVYMFQPGGSPSIAFVQGAQSSAASSRRASSFSALASSRRLYLPNFTDDVIGTISVIPYTETNSLPENQADARSAQENVRRQGRHRRRVGRGVGRHASLSTWRVAATGANADGLEIRRLHEGQETQEPTRPDHDRSVERDIIQNIYIRRVEKRDGKLVNVDIATIADGQGSVEDR